MEIGETITAGGITGEVVEVIETATEKKIKIRTPEGTLAIVTYVRAKSAGLDTMKLG